MADNRQISVLGDSLLGDIRKRNDDQYKASKRDAYKIALGEVGVGLLKKSVAQKASEFLNSEQMMSARVKQNLGYQDAQRVISEQDAIDASGVDAETYYYNLSLPQIKAQVNSNVAEQNYNADKYEALIAQRAAEYAKEKAATHNSAYDVAKTVTSPDQFAEFQKLQVSRHRSPAGALTNYVKSFFGGKTQTELDNETLDAISNSSMIKNAESVTAARKAFSSIGSIKVAQDIVQAIESGKVPKAVAEYKPQLVNKNGTTTKNRYGVETTNFYVQWVDEKGNMKTGPDGKPIVLPVNQSSTPVDTLSMEPEFAKVFDSVTEGEVVSNNRMRQSLVMQSPNEKMPDMVSSYLTQAYAGMQTEEGSFDMNGAMAMFDKTLAALTVQATERYGLSNYNASKLMNQIFLNDLERASTSDFSLWSMGDVTKVDISKMPVRDVPSAVDIVYALGELEGRYEPVLQDDGTTVEEFKFGGNAMYYTDSEIQNLMGSLATDFGSMSSMQQNDFVSEILSKPDKYPFMMEKNPEGVSPIEALIGQPLDYSFSSDQSNLINTGEKTPEGRPIYTDENGSWVTEKSITIENPSINNGKPTNIPTVYNGRILSQDEAEALVIESGGKDPITGRKLEAYDSISEAVSAALKRSDSLGNTIGSVKDIIPNPPPQTLTQGEIDTLGFVPEGYSKMTSGKYALDSRSGGVSRDWTGSEFSSESYNEAQIRKRATKIYKELNPDTAVFNTDAWEEAMSQARDEFQ